MKHMRFVLMIANAAAMVVLLAIPVGKVFGWIEQDIEAAAVYGWLIYFVPVLAAALALWGIRRPRAVLGRRALFVAMPGSFLLACLSVYSAWQGPPGIRAIAIVATILFALNTWALWGPFRDHLGARDAT